MQTCDAEDFLCKDKSGKGSMGPKVEAALKFVQDGVKRAVIASIEASRDSVQGTTGTQIIRTLEDSLSSRNYFRNRNGITFFSTIMSAPTVFDSTSKTCYAGCPTEEKGDRNDQNFRKKGIKRR
jgi:hypothetical protein